MDKRVSPDGLAVAIRMDPGVFGVPAGAWGVMHSQRAGYFASDAEVADWQEWVS